MKSLPLELTDDSNDTSYITKARQCITRFYRSVTANQPVEGGYGIITTYALSLVWIVQWADDASYKKRYVRVFQNGTWSKWENPDEKSITVYHNGNTEFNSEYISTFTFIIIESIGLLHINIEALSFKKAGINITNVIKGLPHTNRRYTIQISDWKNNTGMLRYETDGSITMVWDHSSSYECSGNAVIAKA
mgnify:CR=1 FL=1